MHLVLRHESGITSTVSLTQFAPPPAEHFEVTLWGEAGLSTMPHRSGRPDEPLALAARELLAAAESGEPHPVDVRFGARVVELLAQAQDQLDQARPAAVAPHREVGRSPGACGGR